MANSSVSVYIDDTSIRLMVNRGRRITKLASVPLDLSLSDIDTKEKEAQLTEKIKTLFKSNKVSDRKIILGLSGLHCLTRPIVLPELPRAMVKEAIMREAKRVLPVPLEQLYISWQIVSVSAGRIQAFMIAIPRQIADMVMRVFSPLGCKPYLMDIKPIALARLAKEATALIVDVQSKEFDIIIIISGMPQPVRTVSFPGEALSISEKLSIVKEDIKRTIQFYNSNNPDSQIQPNATMYVSGELAEEPELYEPLTSELGLKAAVLTSPLKCIKQLDPSHHLVNVGLALKQFTREVGPLLPNINVLPEPYQPKQVSMFRLTAIPATGIAVAIIVLLVITVQNAAGTINSAQNDLSNTQFMLTKKQAEKKDLALSVANIQQQITDSQNAYEAYTNALKGLNSTSELVNSDVQAIIDNMITGLTLENVNYSLTQVTLSGTAVTEQQVLQYVRNLDTTGKFSEITISSIKIIVTDDGYPVQYSLNCTLKENRD